MIVTYNNTQLFKFNQSLIIDNNNFNERLKIIHYNGYNNHFNEIFSALHNNQVVFNWTANDYHSIKVNDII